MLTATHNLAELEQNLDRVADLSSHAAAALLGDCEAMLVRYQRLRDQLLLHAARAQTSATIARPDIVNIEEAAAMIGRSVDWLYRNARNVPFTIQEGRGCRLRFSVKGIERYLREHQTAESA